LPCSSALNIAFFNGAQDGTSWQAEVQACNEGETSMQDAHQPKTAMGLMPSSRQETAAEFLVCNVLKDGGKIGLQE